MDSHQNPHRLKSRVAIPWTITRIVLTVIFSVVIVIALVFPAAAQAYAQASIPALGDGAVSNIPIPEDEPIAPSDSLDIRSLPLLDERSATLWEDPSNADTVGRTVFADQWDEVVEAANSPISSLDIMPFTTVDNSTLDHVREIVAQRLDELGSEGEQKALNLMSLLENYGDIRASGDERNGDLLIIAAALAYELPEHYDSCDTWLNAMHFFEMFVRDNDDEVREHFDKAVAACPADPTATVERLKFNLTGVYGCATRAEDDIARLINAGDFDTVNTIADDAIRSFPASPAVRAIAGDWYLFASQYASASRFGTFTSERFLKRAVQEYATAVELTNAPEVTVAYARALNAYGDYQRSVDVLDGDAAALAASGGQSALAWALAHIGKYAEAVTAQTRALDNNDKPVASRPAIIRGTGAVITQPAGGQSVRFPFPCGAGASVELFSYVPESRDVNGLTYSTPRYDDANRNRLAAYAWMAGDYDAGETACDVGVSEGALCEVISSGGDIRSAAGGDEVKEAQLRDYLQNIWRLFGRRDKAMAVLQEMSDSDVSIIHERIGELLFLDGDYRESAEESEEAVAHYAEYCPVNGSADDFTGPVWAGLRAATAWRMAGDLDRAAEDLQFGDLRTICDDSFDGEPDISIASTFIYQEFAQHAYENGDYANAQMYALRSIQAREEASDYMVDIQRGAMEQLVSLAYFAMEDYPRAELWAQSAVEADPYSPLYTEQLADSQRQVMAMGESPGDAAAHGAADGDSAMTDDGSASASGDDGDDDRTPSRETVIANYQRALDINDSLFSSWNNMGVLQIQVGRIEEARNSFRHAVAANPKYATGWFNLGVAESQIGGAAAFIRAQGSFGRAGQLDADLKGAERNVIFDNTVYQSGLDVSKDIPRDWTLNSTLRRGTQIVSIGVAVIGVARIIHDLVLDKLLEAVTERGIPLFQRRRRSRGINAAGTVGAAAGTVDVKGGNGVANHVRNGVHGVVGRVAAGVLVGMLGIFSRFRRPGDAAAGTFLPDEAMHPNTWRQTVRGTLDVPWLTTMISLAVLMSLSGAYDGWEWWCALAGCVVMLLLPAIASAWVSGTGTGYGAVAGVRGDGCASTGEHGVRSAAMWPDRHRSCWPASMLSLILLVPQIGFTPPAPLDVDDESLACRKENAGVVALTIATLLLAAMAVWTAVPLCRILASSALIVLGSVLTPIAPLDGVHVRFPAWLEHGLSILLIVGTVLASINVL